MNEFVESIGGFLSSIGFGTLFGVGLVIWIAINLFIVGGWTGFTILPSNGFKFARFTQSWVPKALAVAALAGATKVVLQFASAPLVIVPGILTFRLDNLFAVAFGVIGGPPAAWGLMFGNIIGDTLAGTLNVGSIGGALANFFANLLIFVMVRDARMNKAIHFVQYYLYVIVSTIFIAIYLGVWFEMVRLAPTEVIWTAIVPGILVAVPPSIILGPVLIKLLYPLMDRWGLTAPDIGFRWTSGPRLNDYTDRSSRSSRAKARAQAKTE
jgi:energy-coupling factor transport system substrate-specific component